MESEWYPMKSLGLQVCTLDQNVGKHRHRHQSWFVVALSTIRFHRMMRKSSRWDRQNPVFCNVKVRIDRLGSSIALRKKKKPPPSWHGQSRAIAKSFFKGCFILLSILLFSYVIVFFEVSIQRSAVFAKQHNKCVLRSVHGTQGKNC